MVYLSGYTPTPPRPEITKTAIGAEEHVSWRSIDDPGLELQRLKTNNYTIAGLEQTDKSVMLSDYQPKTNQMCLLLGNEVTGIDSELLPWLDDAVEIPQFGIKHSLNVSVACGIALYAFCDKIDPVTKS